MNCVPGIVTSAAPLQVQLDDSDSDAPANYLGSYTPSVGDRVVVLKPYGKRQLLVLGEDVSSS